MKGLKHLPAYNFMQNKKHKLIYVLTGNIVLAYTLIMSCMKKAAAKQLFLFKGSGNTNDCDNFSEQLYTGAIAKIAAIVEYSGYDFGGQKGNIPIHIV